MYTSRLTQKYQATIPREVRNLLDLHEGDLVGFEVQDQVITVRKITPLDLEFAKALEGTLNEWNSDSDDALYKNL